MSDHDRDTDTAISRRVLLTGAAAAGAAIAAGAQTAPVKEDALLLVGVGRRVITPDPLLPVTGGMGPTKPVREKRGDLTARALCLRRGGTTLVIVGLDLLGFPSVLADRVRARVRRVPASNIIIGATHTHSGPDVYAFPDGQGGHTGDLAYMERVCALTAEAANEAVDTLRPGALRIASGVAEGKIAYNYYAPDLYDRRMAVLQAVDAVEKPVCTLVNYATHPEVLGNDVGILSPDLCGPLYDRIEERGGGMGLFMNSAQGGMVTADNRDMARPKDTQRGYWEDDRVWGECVRIGHLMADEALRIIGPAPLQQRPALYCRAVTVTLPVESRELWAVVTLSPLKYPHNPKDRTIRTRLNLLNIGDAQVLTIPGEALPNIGFYVKRKMRGKTNMLFGLTNDAFGYILTRVDYKSFPRYDYVSRVSLGEMTGEVLIEKWLDLIASSPAPAP